MVTGTYTAQNYMSDIWVFIRSRPGYRQIGKSMLIIGLTGGIACGKSTVTAELRKKGLPVIDADLIAKETAEKVS